MIADDTAAVRKALEALEAQKAQAKAQAKADIDQTTAPTPTQPYFDGYHWTDPGAAAGNNWPCPSYRGFVLTEDGCIEQAPEPAQTQPANDKCPWDDASADGYLFWGRYP